MIKYYNGEIDERHTLRTTVNGGRVYAIQINPDGSKDPVCYDDYDYDRDRREADVVIDAAEEDYRLEQIWEAKYRIGKGGTIAKVGDIVKVVKGRKFDKGLVLEVINNSIYVVNGTYEHKQVRYLHFKDKDGNINKIIAENTKIIGNKLLEELESDNKHSSFDDEDFDIDKKPKTFTKGEIRDELIKELKEYRKSDKNVKDYEKQYHSMFNTNLRTMTVEQLNDMITYIIHCKIMADGGIN